MKRHILEATELAHLSEDLPLVLATDASSLPHIHPDGKERLKAFASRTLDVHQVRYTQIEKEVLSVIFGVKNITDHKPLVTTFNPSKHLLTMISNRLQT